ncbi:GSCOCG00010693001-RA-CDS, partial [Cotesia congregata]
YKDATGTNSFQELSDFAFSILLLPYSNAEVERVFSAINLVKTKLRNKMNSEITNALLTIRAGLKRCGKNCNTYEFPDDVLQKIGTMQAY